MAVDWVSIIGTAGGTVIGVGASIYLFHHQINNSLTKIYETVQYLEQQMQIINDRSGVVTYEQGVEIVEMYLVSIEYNLRDHALFYFMGNYKDDLKNGNIASIEVSIDSEADKVISNCRRQVAVFRLPGGETFKHFLEKLHPLNSGLIDDTKKMGITYFSQKERESESLQQLINAYANMLHISISSANKDIRFELERRYSMLQLKNSQDK